MSDDGAPHDLIKAIQAVCEGVEADRAIFAQASALALAIAELPNTAVCRATLFTTLDTIVSMAKQLIEARDHVH